jgi:hypothetical protein
MRTNYFSFVKALAIATLVTIFTACSGNSNGTNSDAKSSDNSVTTAQGLTITIKGATATATDANGNEYSGKQHAVHPDYYEFVTPNDPETNLIYKVLFQASTKIQIGSFSDKRVFYVIYPEEKLILEDGSETTGVVIAESKQDGFPAVRHPWWAVYTLDGKMVHLAIEPQNVGVQDGYIIYQNARKEADWKINIKTGEKTAIPRKKK